MEDQVKHHDIIMQIIYICTVYIRHFSGNISDCPDGTQEQDGFCYDIQLVPATYSVARSICQSRGGEVVSIRDENEQNFVTSLV